MNNLNEPDLFHFWLIEVMITYILTHVDRKVFPLIYNNYPILLEYYPWEGFQ